MFDRVDRLQPPADLGAQRGGAASLEHMHTPAHNCAQGLTTLTNPTPLQIWVPTEAEREADRQAARQAAVIAVVVIVGPIALAGALLAKFQGALNF